jgi:nicotinamidase-related amidase
LNSNVVVLTDCCLNVAREQHAFKIEHIEPRFARNMTSDEALALLEAV